MKNVLTLCMLSCILQLAAGQLKVWLSTGDSVKKLNPEPNLSGRSGPVGGYTINVQRNQQGQSVKGFGAALSNSAAYLIANSFERENILQGLFSRTNGIGLSYVRLVMGGSDFNAVNPYTYDDAGFEDFNLVQFNIAKDREFVIPVLKDILRINPEVRIMATPWSAPAWMKNPWTLYGGEMKPGGQYHGAYAEYLVRFVQAYQAEGIRIDTLTIQNEPQHQTGDYMTMSMSWVVQRDIIRYHLGPKFQQAGITTEILIWDHNWKDTWYPINILNDPEAKQYIAGTAWHCYEGGRWDPLAVIHAHPDKDTYLSECAGGDWDNHFGSVLGWNMQNVFIGQLRLGARTVLLWNMALDENHGPIVGSKGCTNCRGVVTVRANRFHEKNVEYYTLGHFSTFIRPGARRLETQGYESQDLENVAFLNPDGSVVVVVANMGWGDTTKTFQIELDGVWYYYENLPSRSAVTFVKN